MLEDYAFLIQGLLDLYETSFEVKWLSWAMRLQEQQDALFWDADGGYFATRAEASGRPRAGEGQTTTAPNPQPTRWRR